MPTFISLAKADGAFSLVEDPFTAVGDEQSIPPGDVIISLTRFQAEGEDPAVGEGRAVGVRLGEPRGGRGAGLRPAADQRWWRLAPFRSSATAGPTTATPASCASGSHFKGQVRAVGEVLREQAGFMVRCGFDAFEPADGSTLDGLGKGHPALPPRLSTLERRPRRGLRGSGEK